VYVALLVWIAIATLLSFIIERLWSGFTGRPCVRYALAPGVMVHELSHLVACVITGAKVSRVVLFSRSGGRVEHSRPAMPLLGQPVISLAPVAGCTLALWGVWRLFAGRLGLEASGLPGVEFSAAWGVRLWLTLKRLFLDSFQQVFSREFLSPEGFVFLYLVLTFSICMAPSRADLRHAVFGLAGIAAIVFLVQQLDLSGWVLGVEMSRRIMAFGWKVFTFSILLQMLALAVSIPAALAGRILGDSQ
jgi:hypothetical protein